ncbi:MAG: PucR family transcriptional regulator [Bilifractor sp.]
MKITTAMLLAAWRQQRKDAGEEELSLKEMERPGQEIRQMLLGETIARDQAADIIGRYGWNMEDEFFVVVIRFIPEKGWEVQLKTTLPFLTSKLEQQWLSSCAVHTASEIVLVLDGTILQKSGKNGKSARSVYQDVMQQMAYFVRDNVCRAGVSPLFHEFSELGKGVRAAQEALRIGMSRKPYLWYYLFDDIRLDYFLQQAQNELPVSLLEHPALHILEDYDRKHGTELSLTLKTFLQTGLNMTKAAEKLYVHRTTFCRRMDHIRRLTGLDLEDPDTLLTLQISYRL